MKKKTSYAYSLKTRRVKEDEFPYNDEIMSTPEAVEKFLKNMGSFDIEKMIVIYLDSKNSVIGIQIQEGTLDQTSVYPREIAKFALLHNSNSVILAHNHPSNSLNPSQSDRELTKAVKEALSTLHIKLHDHFIITEEGSYSFANHGLI